ncbi:MAG: hypothetical protein VXZ39_11735, partial [Planctomycetota bacterium]|nr:hypothetical protein [Planctomycetota bacterium]
MNKTLQILAAVVLVLGLGSAATLAQSGQSGEKQTCCATQCETAKAKTVANDTGCAAEKAKARPVAVERKGCGTTCPTRKAQIVAKKSDECGTSCSAEKA